MRRCANLEGAPRTRYGDPVSYFEKVKERGTENVFTGEIYLAWHRGTYTAQAKTKKGVRRAEVMLKEAEYWNTVLALQEEMTGSFAEDRGGRIKDLWKRLLFQEFHDILPGTGIAKVHREAEQELEAIYIEGKQILQESLTAMEEKTAGEGGAEEPEAILPQSMAGRTEDGGYFLQSDYLYAEVDGCGRIVSLLREGEVFADKEKPMNTFRLYRNINGYYDAWELGSMYEQEEDFLDRKGWEMKQTSYQGRDAFLLTGTIRKSPFSQIICLSEDGLFVEFHTRIDWKERHRMLKVDFPSTVHSGQVTGEIAFGTCSRPTTASYQWEKDRYEVSGHRYSVLENGGMGIAVFNDSKYGYSAKEDRISLTLLRSPIKPDQHADQGIQEFSYACYPFIGDMVKARVAQKGILFNRKAHVGAEILKKEALLAAKTRIFTLTAKEETCHVLTESVKLAEDGSGQAVIRLYEACGQPQSVRLCPELPIGGIWATNLLEQDGKRLETEEGSVLLKFRNYRRRQNR